MGRRETARLRAVAFALVVALACSVETPPSEAPRLRAMRGEASRRAECPVPVGEDAAAGGAEEVRSEAGHEGRAAAAEAAEQEPAAAPARPLSLMLRCVADCLPRFGLASGLLRTTLLRQPSPRADKLTPLAAPLAAAAPAARLLGLAALGVGSFGVTRRVLSKALPRALHFVRSTDFGGIDLSPDAVTRNVADFGMDYALEGCTGGALGWGWAKRIVAGIDEEESGVWAAIRGNALGLKAEESCAFWRWSRRLLLGVHVRRDADSKGEEGEWNGLAAGVDVRFEGDVGYSKLGGSWWGELVRDCADVVLCRFFGSGEWMWAKRLLFDLDEEEDTGMWRVVKALVLRIPRHAGGVYTLQQPDQYPLMGRNYFWDKARLWLFGLYGPIRPWESSGAAEG